MTAFGWDSTLGNDLPQASHSQPILCYPMSCRLCNKTFVTTQGVISHYQAHVNELIPRRNPSNSRQHNINPTLGLPMTPPLPFFENSHQMMHHRGHLTNTLITNSTFFGASSSPQLFPSMYPTPIANHANPSRLMSPSASTLYRNKRKFQAQLHQAIRYNNVLSHQPPAQPSQANKRYKGRDESCTQTSWYLDQLDSSPKIIYLEDEDELKCADVDLSLKL